MNPIWFYSKEKLSKIRILPLIMRFDLYLGENPSAFLKKREKFNWKRNLRKLNAARNEFR